MLGERDDENDTDNNDEEVSDKLQQQNRIQNVLVPLK